MTRNAEYSNEKILKGGGGVRYLNCQKLKQNESALSLIILKIGVLDKRS